MPWLKSQGTSHLRDLYDLNSSKQIKIPNKEKKMKWTPNLLEKNNCTTSDESSKPRHQVEKK